MALAGLLFAYWLILHALLSSADFFQNQLFKKFFQEYHQSVKQFGSRSGRHIVGPDLNPNCLQRLSADGSSRPTLCLLRNFACFFVVC